MANQDVFAFKNSGLNVFLFSEVGRELNGSSLTVLSVLARLGEDPWEVAARWAKMSRRAATECLIQDLARMPLTGQAMANAPATAARLIRLLPRSADADMPAAQCVATQTTMPAWAPVWFFYCAVAVGMAANLFMMPTQVASVRGAHAQILDQIPQQSPVP